MIMIFTCDNCGFIFSRSEETEQCPDCGKYEVRPANESEQEEFAERMAELSRSEHSEAPRQAGGNVQRTGEPGVRGTE